MWDLLVWPDLSARMPGLPRDSYSVLVSLLPESPLACIYLQGILKAVPGATKDIVLAIYSQECQYRVMKNHHLHKQQIHTYCNRYLAGTDILDLCGDVEFPPCLMMRRLLEHWLQLPKQRVNQVLKDPSTLHQLLHPPPNTLSRGPGALPSAAALTLDLLQRLEVDVVRCVAADPCYSPLSDAAKTLAGLEHEALLYQALTEAGLHYWTEEELRAKGMFKTPDALLQVPFSVHHPATGAWHLVHWMDSKACFGDERVHAQAVEGQYSTYVNRYGPGAVIYWCGYLEGLEGPPEVLVLDAFPQPGQRLQL